MTSKATERIHRMLRDLGWHRLRGDSIGETWYRWDGAVRVELSLVYDRSGRLEAWSVWNNYRIDIDQGAGRRQRVEWWVQEQGK